MAENLIHGSGLLCAKDSFSFFVKITVGRRTIRKGNGHLWSEILLLIWFVFFINFDLENLFSRIPTLWWSIFMSKLSKKQWNLEKRLQNKSHNISRVRSISNLKRSDNVFHQSVFNLIRYVKMIFYCGINRFTIPICWLIRKDMRDCCGQIQLNGTKLIPKELRYTNPLPSFIFIILHINFFIIEYHHLLLLLNDQY